MRISQKVKGVTMSNLHDTIFCLKTNILQDFHICISVPLKKIAEVLVTVISTLRLTKVSEIADL